MERRILAELFVEDDRAIEEDLGTIDYVEREAGWMSESGISVGQMRILDDDDPEDAKAIDLTKKIFKSEENKPTFIYVVKIDATIDGSTDTEMKVFSTREKAKAYFDECVADEKANDPLMKLDDKVVSDYENYFSVYHDGYWVEDHYEITIEKGWYIEMKNWNKEIAKEINPQITIKIAKEDVVDILSSALNGGIGYWGELVLNDRQYEEAKKWLRENAEPDYDDGEICYEEIIAQMLFDGRSITIRDIEEDRESWLSLSNLAIGIQTAFRDGFYSSYNWLVPDGDGFGEWHLETSQIDSEVSDVIIQFAVWGEVVYG